MKMEIKPGVILRSAADLRLLSYGDVIRRTGTDQKETWVVEGQSDDDVWFTSSLNMELVSSAELFGFYVDYYLLVPEFKVLWVEPK